MDESKLAVDLNELERVAELVHATVPPTPQHAWPKLRRRAGCTVWVKHENHTPTGAFKVRGGIVYFARLAEREPGIPGVVSAISGTVREIVTRAGRCADAIGQHAPCLNHPATGTAKPMPC